MKRRLLDIFLTILIVSMLSGLLYSQNIEEIADNQISDQISDFEEQIGSSEVIQDGNIDEELPIDYSGNEISKFSAKISIKIQGMVKGTINFIHKILKKIVS